MTPVFHIRNLHQRLVMSDAAFFHILKQHTRVILFIVFAFAILFRMPAIAWQGRFFGEEGANFFAYAWHFAPSEALWHPLGGYLNIVASGVTMIAACFIKAGWLPLEQAPHLTVAVSFLFQLCSGILILTSRARWLEQRWAVIAALFAIAAMPGTEEVFLNTLHVQFHLAVCVLIMITTEPARAYIVRIGRLFLAFLAPLCGPLAIVLLPLAILRAWIDRSRLRWEEAGMLTMGSAIQLLFFYTPSVSRTQAMEPLNAAAALFTRHVITPLAGQPAGEFFGDIAYAAVASGQKPWAIALAGIFYIGYAAWLAMRQKNVDAGLLLCAGLLIAGISYYRGLLVGYGLFNPYMGQRYNFVPQAAFTFALIALIRQSSGAARTRLVVPGVAMALVGIFSYSFPDTFISQGPDWRLEVVKWRADHSYQPKIWPAGWTVDLSDIAVPCPRNCQVAVSEYCDCAWDVRQRGELQLMQDAPAASSHENMGKTQNEESAQLQK